MLSTVKKNKFHIFACLFFAIITVVMFGDFFADRTKTIESVDQSAAFGVRVLYKDAILEHRQFPTWNPTMLSGMPTVDAMFGDVLYPPVLPIKLALPVHRAMPLKMIMHIFLAGVFFYILLIKGFRTPALVAFTGALFYMLNPQFFSHIFGGHDAKMYVIALLPLSIWRLKCLMEKPNILNASFLSALVGLMLLTSHIQLTYLVLWGLFFYWVFFLVLKYREEKQFSAVTPSLVWFWVAVLFGITLAAVQFYPSFMYVQNEFSGRGVGKGFEYAASWSMHWPEVFSLWIPEFGNTLSYYWGDNPFKLNHEYPGAMALLFGVLAIVYKPKNAWRLLWAGIALFALLYSLGGNSFVFRIAYHIIPGVSKFRAASMFMFWFSFSLILLTSLFLKDVMMDFFEKSAAEKKNNTKPVLITMAVISALALLFSFQFFCQTVINLLCDTLDNPEKFRVFETNYSKNFVPFLWLWWFFAMTALALLLGVIQGKISKKIFVSVVMVIGLIDLMRVDSMFVKVIPAAPRFHTEPAVGELSREMKEHPFRILPLQGSFPVENSAGIHRLEEVSGFHDNEIKWYAEFRGERTNGNYMSNLITLSGNQQYLSIQNIRKGNPFLDLANVQYVLTRDNRGKVIAVENENALDRISFVPTFVQLDEDEIVRSLRTGRYDIRKAVALLEPPQSGVSPKEISEKVNNDVNLKWEVYSPNYRKATIESPKDGFLRISEVYYPGWEILVDGVRAPTYRSDLSWIAIEITGGKHTIELKPKSLYLGQARIATFSVAIILIGIWILFLIKKRTTSKNTSGNENTQVVENREVNAKVG